MSPQIRPYLPIPDRDSESWWSRVRDHELVIQKCQECGSFRWPPRAICGRCWNFDWDWTLAPSVGTVATWTVTHQPYVPGIDVPYENVVVRLDLDGCHLYFPGTWHGDVPPTTGMQAIASFQDLVSPDGVPFTLLGWAPLEA